MNLSLLYKPGKLIERLALEIKNNRRLAKIKNTSASRLKIGHLDSLELLEIINQDNKIRDDAVIFDIGSNEGTWTLLAKSILPAATIHAFEPLKKHTDVFEKNCEQLTGVYLHRFCVGSQNMTGVINISSYSDSSSLLMATPLEFQHFNIQKESEEHVEIKKIADLIDNQTLSPPDIIKLDIQGFELEALKGTGAWLGSVKYIICEVSFKEYYFKQPQFLDIANYLAEFDIYIFAFGNNTPIGRELNQIDILFKHT